MQHDHDHDQDQDHDHDQDQDHDHDHDQDHDRQTCQIPDAPTFSDLANVVGRPMPLKIRHIFSNFHVAFKQGCVILRSLYGVYNETSR